jgi:hypothetical protein
VLPPDRAFTPTTPPSALCPIRSRNSSPSRGRGWVRGLVCTSLPAPLSPSKARPRTTFDPPSAYCPLPTAPPPDPTQLVCVVNRIDALDSATLPFLSAEPPPQHRSRCFAFFLAPCVLHRGQGMQYDFFQPRSRGFPCGLSHLDHNTRLRVPLALAMCALARFVSVRHTPLCRPPSPSATARKRDTDHGDDCATTARNAGGVTICSPGKRLRKS